MQKNDVAFLCYYPLKQRKDNNSFDGNYNIGARVIIDILSRHGIGCGFCSPETAKDYRIVFVSLTSDYDCLAFYKSVVLLKSWQPWKRNFIVVAGGEGMQNPTTIRNYVDYAVFGRGESIISDLVDCVLGGKNFEHKSVMKLPEIYPVVECQPNNLYPYKIALSDKKDWKESFTGCPNKCLFCHYTWSRKPIKSNVDTYYQGDLTMNRSIEILFKDIPQIVVKKEGRIRTAIDGFSERLRFSYGKKITNQEIIDGINHIGSFSGTTVCMVYNISNMPGETQEDREELYATIKKADPKHRVIVVFQSTPFRPSLLTPLQWSRVTLFPSTGELSAHVIHDSDNLRVMHSFSNEGAFSQLATMIISRATVKTDKLFHALAFHQKLKSGTAREKIKLISNSFDLSQYLKEYDHNEKHPAWFYHSYTKKSVLERLHDNAKIY